MADHWADPIGDDVARMNGKVGPEIFLNRPGGCRLARAGSTAGPLAKPTQLAMISSTNPWASGLLVVLGLGGLAGPRLIRRLNAKPRQSAMKSAVQAMNASSEPARTLIEMLTQLLPENRIFPRRLKRTGDQ
jgi:hypothetical protein